MVSVLSVFTDSQTSFRVVLDNTVGQGRWEVVLDHREVVLVTQVRPPLYACAA